MFLFCEFKNQPSSVYLQPDKPEFSAQRFLLKDAKLINNFGTRQQHMRTAIIKMVISDQFSVRAVFGKYLH